MPASPAHHVPQFHIRTPRGFLNDPNGPVEIGESVHLFFQSRSVTDHAMPVQWGHATSADLVRWTLQRPAMSPVPGGPDSDGCWSGNTVLVDGELRAYYSGKLDDRAFQSVLLARADDQLHFGVPERVVDDPAPSEGVTMFRDPFVWRDGADWHMAVGAAEPDQTAAIRHYVSDDGLAWRHAGHLARLPRTTVAGADTGEGWECPQILDADGREVALVSSWAHADGPMRVLAFPLDTATPEPRRVDAGQNFYATSVMRASSFGPVVFAWITEGRDPSWWHEAGWAGAISLPRSAWLRDGVLATEPHANLTSLRLGSPRAADGAEIGAQAEITLPQTTGRLRLRFSETEHLDILVDAERGQVTLDRGAASCDARAHGGTASIEDAFDATSRRPAVRVFLDGSIVEVFTSGGGSLTSRVYPVAAPPWRVEAPDGALVWNLEPSITPSAPVA